MNRNFFCDSRFLPRGWSHQLSFHTPRFLLIALSVFAFSTAWDNGTAHADDDEYSLYMAPSAAQWGSDASNLRPGLALGAIRGLSPSSNFVFELAHHLDIDGSNSVSELNLGLSFALDTFRLIHSVEGLISAELYQGALTPALALGLNLDYLLTPEVSVGLSARVKPLDGISGGLRRFLSVRISWRSEL